MSEVDLSYLENPEVFAINVLKPTSSHKHYRHYEDLKNHQESFKQSLNGEWLFSYAPNPNMRNKTFYKAENVDYHDFKTIKVPGHIEMQGYGQMQYINTLYPWDGHEYLRPPYVSKTDNPVGSYICNFSIKPSLANKHIILRFEGVESAMNVYLNGHFVGYSEDSFTPSSFDITPYILSGTNKLAVEVFKHCSGSWLEDQDMWRFFGIFREVALYGLPDCYIEDVHVTTPLSDMYQKAKVNVALRMVGKDFHFKAKLMEDEDVVASYEGCDTTFSFDLDNPHLWSSEDPYLYQLVIEVYNQKECLEIVPVNVGIREFVMRDGIMQLNGKRIIFRGVNRHEFSCDNGRVISHEEMLYDIRFMKQHNINAVRTSHYPNVNEWYDLCDQYGIYLIDETNMESHGSWQKLGQLEPSWNIPGNLKEWQECVLARAKSMLERDKNHPSVLIYSCGNESYAGEDIVNMANYFRATDPTRLVHYEGCTWNRDYSEATDMESRMYAKAKDIEDYLQNAPKKPYISCEYMHAMGNSLGGMEKYIELEDQYEKYQGGFIWDYIDQAISHTNDFGEKVLGYGGDFDDRNTDYNFCGDGIVFANRMPSPKADEVKYQYQDIILKVDESGVSIRSKRLFKDTSDLIFKYQATQGKEVIREGAFEAIVKPQEEIHVPIDFGTFHPGEVILTVSAHLKEQCLWADQGFEVAFGQYVLGRYNDMPYVEEPLVVIPGDGDLGVKCQDFEVLFSQEGLSSLKYRNKEYIIRGPRPVFMRATTDNERGYAHHFTSNVWNGASNAQALTNMNYHIAEDLHEVSITYEYTVLLQPRVRVELTYYVRSPGIVRVKYHYYGQPHLPEVPLFGTLFTLSHKLDHFSYLGRGPHENYVDRKKGSRIGFFESTVKDNLTPYLKPQACGNRTDVREVTLLDHDEEGLRFTMVDAPFEFTALPFSWQMIDATLHQYELPERSYYTYLTIMNKQMGVGGDDSWGAPVLDEYCLKAEDDQEYIFDIMPIHQEND